MLEERLDDDFNEYGSTNMHVVALPDQPNLPGAQWFKVCLDTSEGRELTWRDSGKAVKIGRRSCRSRPCRARTSGRVA